ncbi:MAG TPA: indole-3-glycerol phosphate synthase TrpC [Acidimicrobiales bacterium]|nr:indole-3-glycerol phosphate synthase TrpC [Acidimicrobiales bacterium]
MSAPTYLDAIMEAHRKAAESAPAGSDLERLREEALGLPRPRPFTAVLRGGSTLAVIAEIKRRSPSKGDLAIGLDPAEVAREYEAGGAACISVLTDGAFFSGSPDDLESARSACSVPVLRKDFTVCEADVVEARIMGADAVLLIVSALTDAELARFVELTTDLAMAALVEVHEEEELERALEAGAAVVGVNQRDLTTFEVDNERASRLADRIPPEVVAVAESGIGGAGDASRLADAGYDAVLVGETLVRSEDRQAAVARLAGHTVSPRRGPTVTGDRSLSNERSNERLNERSKERSNEEMSVPRCS